MERALSLITAAFPVYLLFREVQSEDISVWRVWLCLVAILAPMMSTKAGKAVHLASLGLSVALTASLAAQEN